MPLAFRTQRHRQRRGAKVQRADCWSTTDSAIFLMAKFRLRLESAATLALLALTTGCSSLSLPHAVASKTASALHHLNTDSVTSQESPSNCRRIDPFTKGIDKAGSAATLAQSAKSKQDWDAVIAQWIQAIAAMQAVPPGSARRAFAQKKVAEYLQNLEMAMQKASTTASQLPFASFNNPIFDEQLLLYLSYTAAVGTPDVLIVGSSRALVGVDPQQLQQALAAQGKGNLKIFNFGVNGATAQLVDFQLRQVLSREQLPRLILWADGVRAFNSGRPDRTYSTMTTSEGYQRLQTGERPKLPQNEPNTVDTCEDVPPMSMSQPTSQLAKNFVSSAITATPSYPAVLAESQPFRWGDGETGRRGESQCRTFDRNLGSGEQWKLLHASVEQVSQQTHAPDEPMLLAHLDGIAPPSRITLARGFTGYSSLAIKANGFLPLENRFDPNIYYQKNPRVSGRYDADYQPFSLIGQQITALNTAKAFAKQQKIPLVFVNLPLTQDYLDSVRRLREQQFQQWMQQQAGDGLIWVDMGRQLLNRNEYFTDPSHLNRYGAAAVASQLASNPQIPWPQPRQ